LLKIGQGENTILGGRVSNGYPRGNRLFADDALDFDRPLF